MFVDDVNFFTLLELGTLENDCNDHKYPPRISLEVSSGDAVSKSVIKVTFTGAKREFSTEILLSWPQSESKVQVLLSER